jgi:hypothetical protein
MSNIYSPAKHIYKQIPGMRGIFNVKIFDYPIGEPLPTYGY